MVIIMLLCSDKSKHDRWNNRIHMNNGPLSLQLTFHSFFSSYRFLKFGVLVWPLIIVSTDLSILASLLFRLYSHVYSIKLFI